MHAHVLDWRLVHDLEAMHAVPVGATPNNDVSVLRSRNQEFILEELQALDGALVRLATHQLAAITFPRNIINADDFFKAGDGN